MMKRVVVLNGMIYALHELSENVEGRYDDDIFEVFVMDQDIVPFYEYSYTPVPPAMQEFNLIPVPTATPLTDPRLRCGLSDCIDLTIQVVKSYCGNLILDRYPAYKQSNIAMLLGYEQSDLDAMREYILGVREASNEIEEILKKIDTNQKVVSFNYKAFINKKVK